jgi:hypothetical protein
MRDALGENWYSQLKHLLTAYRKVQPIQIHEHLSTQCCPVNVHAKKLLKAKYWTEWDGDMHLKMPSENGSMTNKFASTILGSASLTKTNSNSIWS